MTPWRVQRCSSDNCGAAIVWAKTENGLIQPFDAVPNPKGNRRLEARGQTWRGEGVPTAVPASAGQGDLFGGAGEVYMPHHATCPDADRWRYQRDREGAQR